MVSPLAVQLYFLLVFSSLLIHPQFKLGVFSSNSTPHSSDIMNLLHSIERKIFHILNQLEYHFQPGFGLDFVPETGLQPE